MQFLQDNLVSIMAVLLIMSEAAAALSQVLFPGNQGLNGALASIIKVLQLLKEPKGK